ncbi:unnamed protein product [Mesocestoides corti]|uniref:Protein-tyrosine-phosphatase n=1 Tax=Mesocestoides corti TaxID=53468 RepID=A0A0R3U524_MESCO|nr:unnamed protein product [Mesocestoides corti]
MPVNEPNHVTLEKMLMVRESSVLCPPQKSSSLVMSRDKVNLTAKNFSRSTSKMSYEDSTNRLLLRAKRLVPSHVEAHVTAGIIGPSDWLCCGAQIKSTKAVRWLSECARDLNRQICAHTASGRMAGLSYYLPTTPSAWTRSRRSQTSRLGDDHAHYSSTNHSMYSQIARINDHLYLSGLQALSPKRLIHLGVTQLISVMMDPVPEDILSTVNSHVQISVEDAEYSNLRVHFDAVGERIAREARHGGRTLVHCMAGISRSATIVLAYLIKHQKMSLADAYHHVRGIRPCIQPNLGFWRQLIAYEEAKRGSRSMRIVHEVTSNAAILPSTSRGALWNHLALTPDRPRHRQYWSRNLRYY